MSQFLSDLLSNDFMPHGHCYFWQPDVLWLNVGSDVLIALAYYSIPLALFVFVRRRKDLAFRSVFVLFAAFILACGTTHLISAWTVWDPVYRVEGLVKLLTGLVSAATAVVLWPLMPRALALPSPEELRTANARLREQVAQRDQARAELLALNDELERRVQERTEELARSNEHLEQFAHAISHDLKEPLRMCSSYVQLLDERYADQLDERAKRYIERAVGGTERMRALITALLRYSRAGTEPLELCEVDVMAVVRDVLNDLAGPIRESRADIRYDALPTVHADGAQLHHVFQNLIANAIKYAGEARPEVHIGARRERGLWRFSVEDHGLGMDPAQVDEVFQVFRRLHPSDVLPGTGMGLAICQRLVERQGGHIWAEGEPGRGAAFHFTIPCGRAEGAGARKEGADERAEGAGEGAQGSGEPR
jgi:signal transduction histidine kinase